MADKKMGAHESAQSKTDGTDSPIVFGGVELRRGTVSYLLVRHDDGCPAILTQSESDCVCEPYAEHVDERKFISAVRQTRAERRRAERAANKAMAKAAKGRA